MTRRNLAPLVLLAFGLAAWAYCLSRLSSDFDRLVRTARKRTALVPARPRSLRGRVPGRTRAARTA